MSGQTTLAMNSGRAPVLQAREWQDTAISGVVARYEEGLRRLLGVAATGLGKTVIFSHLAERLALDTLVLAHRDELVQQAVDKLTAIWPDASIGVVKGSRDESGAQVVVASVQTLAREARLERLGRRRFGLVVVDEAHHAVADTYRRILEYLGCFEDDGPLTLGVTATPDRGDKTGLADVFQQVAFSYDLPWGIRNGYLADLRAIEVQVAVDLGSVAKSRGDYQDGDLGRKLIEANAPATAVQAWLEKAEGRKTIAFTPTVAVAAQMADAFRAAGVAAEFVDGSMPLEVRRGVLDRFSRGETRVLANCAVLTEGYDEPSIECVMMARPTKSRGFYTQMVGRGTRRYPGKEFCLVLDLVGATGAHDLVTVPSLVGVTRESMAGGRATLSEAAAAARLPLSENGRLVTRDVDLFKGKQAKARFAWVDVGGGRFVLPTGDGFVALVPDGMHWRAVEKTEDGFTELRGGVTIELAQGVAEDRARSLASALASKKAAWRARPASEKQAALLSKYGIDPTDMTQGEASDAITARFAARDLRKLA